MQISTLYETEYHQIYWQRKKNCLKKTDFKPSQYAMEHRNKRAMLKQQNKKTVKIKLFLSGDFSHYILCMTNHAWFRVKFAKQTAKTWASTTVSVVSSLFVGCSNFEGCGDFRRNKKKLIRKNSQFCAHNSCRN